MAKALYNVALHDAGTHPTGPSRTHAAASAIFAAGRGHRLLSGPIPAAVRNTGGDRRPRRSLTAQAPPFHVKGIGRRAVHPGVSKG